MVPEPSELRRTPVKNIFVFKEHITTCRAVQASQQMKQSAFSSTRGTNYRDQTCGFDFEMDIFKNKNLRGGSLVYLRETSRLNHSYRSASTG
jgi:hypothetical protein